MLDDQLRFVVFEIDSGVGTKQSVLMDLGLSPLLGSFSSNSYLSPFHPTKYTKHEHPTLPSDVSNLYPIHLHNDDASYPTTYESRLAEPVPSVNLLRHGSASKVCIFSYGSALVILLIDIRLLCSFVGSC